MNAPADRHTKPLTGAETFGQDKPPEPGACPSSGLRAALLRRFGSLAAH